MGKFVPKSGRRIDRVAGCFAERFQDAGRLKAGNGRAVRARGPRRTRP